MRSPRLLDRRQCLSPTPPTHPPADPISKPFPMPDPVSGVWVGFTPPLPPVLNRYSASRGTCPSYPLSCFALSLTARRREGLMPSCLKAPAGAVSSRCAPYTDRHAARRSSGG